jgi:hypothetical protein
MRLDKCRTDRDQPRRNTARHGWGLSYVG